MVVRPTGLLRVIMIPMFLKMLAVVLAVATVITGGGRPTPEPTHQVILGAMTIQGVGDSITYGTGSTDGGGYRTKLDTLITRQHSFVGSIRDPRGYLSDGHGGWTADQLATSVTRWVSAVKATRILIMAGTNDINNGDTPANAFNDLKLLITRAQAASPGSLLAIATIPTIPGKDAQVREYNALVRTLAVRFMPVVDMYVVVTASDLVDGLHPSTAAYVKMATAWYAVL